MEKKPKTDKPRRKRTLRNGMPLKSCKQTTKIPYKTRKTKPLPDISKMDEYDIQQVTEIRLLNRDKQGRPTNMGRKTKYDPKYDHIAYILVKVHGLTTGDLAETLGITVSCLTRWRDTYPNFNCSIKNGRVEFDGKRICKSLKARANGYAITEKSKKYKRTPVYKTMKGKKGEKDITEIVGYDMTLVEETESNKVLPPDVGAIAWWQKNQIPEEWRDRKAVEISGPDGGPVESITTNMDPKEAATIYSQLLKGKE